MLWYLVVFFVLFFLALIERDQRWPGIIASIILGLMCGLRYETGFDWVEYQLHYQYIAGFGDINLYTNVSTFTAESGFELLNRLLKTFDADFQWLLFIIGCFNIFVIYKFVRAFSPLVVIVLIWYYGFVFLPGQMATMRQALSVSFIFLSIINRNDERYASAFAHALTSLLFHTFSLVFVPLVFINAKPWGARRLTLFAVIGAASSLIGGSLFITMAEAALKFADAGFIGEKLEIYSSIQGASVSPLSIILVIWHIAFVWLVQNRNKIPDYIYTISIWSTWLTVMFHTYFADFPILWGRAMLVTFVIQGVQLCRSYYPELRHHIFQAQVTVIAGAGAGLALLYALTSEQALVYEPYQNLAITWIRGPYGNGRLRYQLIRNENDIIINSQKR